MYRLAQVTAPAHRYLWAHALLSIASILVLRTAQRDYDVGLPCMTGFLVCVFRLVYDGLHRVNGGHPLAPPAMLTDDAAGGRGSLLRLLARSCEWPAAEALAATSFFSNSISFHFENLFLLLCVLSLPGVLHHISTPPPASVGAVEGRWRRRCFVIGSLSLLAGAVAALCGLQNEPHHNGGSVAIALLLALVYGRAEALAGGGEGTDSAGVTRGRKPRARWACLVLPAASILFADDYSFYKEGDRPPPLGWLLLFLGCAGRAGAQVLLEMASARCRADPRRGRIARRHQVLVLVVEYFVCLLCGYYYQCEHMSVDIVPHAFLTLLSLTVYYAALEASSNWTRTVAELEDCAEDEERDREEGRRGKAWLFSVVPSLHNGFY